MVSILDFNNIDINLIEFSDYDDNLIIPKYENNNIFFECIGMVDNFYEAKTKYSTYELIIIPDDMTKQFITNLDGRIVDMAIENINNWIINKEKPFLYKSPMKDKNNAQNVSSQIIKLKIMNSKDFKTLLFDENNKMISYNTYSQKMTKGIKIRIILELASLWMRENILGVYLKVHQIKKLKNDEDEDGDNAFDYIVSD